MKVDEVLHWLERAGDLPASSTVVDNRSDAGPDSPAGRIIAERGRAVLRLNANTLKQKVFCYLEATEAGEV